MKAHKVVLTIVQCRDWCKADSIASRLHLLVLGIQEIEAYQTKKKKKFQQNGGLMLQQ